MRMINFLNEADLFDLKICFTQKFKTNPKNIFNNALEQPMLICGIFFLQTNASDVVKDVFLNIVRFKKNPPLLITLNIKYKWPPTRFCACSESKHRSYKILIP